MSVTHSTEGDNPACTKVSDRSTAEQLAGELEQAGTTLRSLMTDAVSNGDAFDTTERAVWDAVRTIGFQALELFIRLQGVGDLGDHVATDEKSLQRSKRPTATIVRSIFGRHSFKQFTYSSGKNRAIELSPISARMQLPANQWSYFLQEFSQMFCVDQAFGQAAENLETVLGSPFSVDTLEQTNQRMGEQADAFLDQLPTPQKSDEGKLLVASADCKGVPLIRDDTAKVPAFDTAKKNPGNRRMATVTSVYSVDAYRRTPEEILAALFRDEGATEETKKKRPQPKFKHTMAHFPTTVADGEATIAVSGIHEGVAWLGAQVSARRKKRQPLILLMDGQECLWDVAGQHLQGKRPLVEILDIIHVSTYVWEASSLFQSTREHREAFTRERLLKILQGDVRGVIRGLRRMGSLAKLNGEKLKTLQRICGYFEKHKARMRYDQYLAAGYPIASGVIEGACGHLVKDRMERSGMRWTLECARSMLNVRAVFQSDYWKQFHQQRIAKLNESLHPHRKQLGDYSPLTLAC
jgi:hypothetical protein